MKIRLARLAIILPALLLIIACESIKSTSIEEVAAVTLDQRDPLPSPPKKTALTITGQIFASNSADSLLLDIRTIERLGLVKYAVDDPRLKESITFTGVLLSDFLAYVSDGLVTNIHIVASDDSQVDIPFADIERWPILLATRANGEPLTKKDYGPTRIVYPYGDYPIDPASHDDMWIWNVKTIDLQ